MDTPTPQPPNGQSYALYTIAISLAGGIGVFLKGRLVKWWANRHPTDADKAALLEKNWNIAEKVLHRMDDMQKIIDLQSAQIRELEEIKAKYESLKPYARRLEDRLKAHRIDLPERWQSGDDL